MKKEILIIGMGNDIRGDDGLSFYIIDRVKEYFPDVEFIKTSEAGLNLIDMFHGYKKVFLIDTICDPKEKPGKIVHHSINVDDLSKRMNFTHNTGVLSILNVCKKLKMDISNTIDIILVNIIKNNDFEDQFSMNYDFVIKKIHKILNKRIN